MRNDVFQDWRREREAVEQEMDLLITAGLPASNEERQVRRARFAALIERREAAARSLLQSGWAHRRDRSPMDSSRDPATSAAAVSAASVAADTAESPSDAMALVPDTPTPIDSDAAPTSDLPADVAEPSTEIAALAPDATAPVTDSAAVTAADPPADAVELLVDDIALAPDAAAHSVAVATPADAAPLAGDAEVRSSPSSDDFHPDALLLKLLRRLKPN